MKNPISSTRVTLAAEPEALKLFITGLCFQGNLGGPALALSLTQKLNDRLKNPEIVFAVPGGLEFALEKAAAARYGCSVVPSMALKHLLPPQRFKACRRQDAHAFFSALRGADAIIDMTALTYVSPPGGTILGALNNRHFFYRLSRWYRKPFLAWTQTYGPFDNAAVRALAKADLAKLPRIYCRGDDTLRAVAALLPGHDVRSFPDIACTLSTSEATPSDVAIPQRAVVLSLSPSAVIYSATGGGGSLNAHVKLCAELLKRCEEAGYGLLLIPHTVRQLNASPGNCDLCVARETLRLAGNPPGATLVEDPRGPREAKALIAGTAMHIGARYHSLVAALSSGVPALSLAWHHKYRDLMREFGCENQIVDALQETDVDRVWSSVERILSQRQRLADDLSARQRDIETRLEENIALFVEDLLALLETTAS